MRKIYLAAPIVGITDTQKSKIELVESALMNLPDTTVYIPSEHGVPNAWGMTMEEWSKCIFALDVVAIDHCDWVVVCDFGRHMTGGTSWEVGYAFGKGKKILAVKMGEDEETDYSVMMNGCSSNSIGYQEFVNLSSTSGINIKTIEAFFVERGRLKQNVTYN